MTIMPPEVPAFALMVPRETDVPPITEMFPFALPVPLVLMVLVIGRDTKPPELLLVKAAIMM